MPVIVPVCRAIALVYPRELMLTRLIGEVVPEGASRLNTAKLFVVPGAFCRYVPKVYAYSPSSEVAENEGLAGFTWAIADGQNPPAAAKAQNVNSQLFALRSFT